MKFESFIKQILQWLLIASFFSAGLVIAQSEPTLNQVYAAAQSGKLDQAQLMIQQVLISHPNSAKAFFVQSELYAKQANLAKAREALATAEKLAPGLPFAKAQSVQNLRSQLSENRTPQVLSGSTARPTVLDTSYGAAPVTPASSPFSWFLPLLLAGGVIGLGYFLFRKRQPNSYAPANYSNQNGMNGPQNFGMGNAAVMQPPPYGQTPGSGLGGRIMGGVATGLAVGAGVMAAEAIGRNLFGDHTPSGGATNTLANNDFQALNSNTDMGGADFGINDASSWDDGASADVGGGLGDWDI
jgi:hypothetical protein